MNIGIVYTIIRKEEKLIIDELEKAGHNVIKINDKEKLLKLNNNKNSLDNDNEHLLDIVLMRSMSLQRSLWFAKYFETIGVKVVNSYNIIDTCGNKYLTTLKLIKEDIQTPNVIMAFGDDAATKAMEELGFPCVVKPIIGSWGRLIAKVNDHEAAEILLEHKKMMNSSMQSVLYIQEFIETGNEDIRTIVIGNKVIGAIKRIGKKWKTNTHLGAEAKSYTMTKELEEISLKVAKTIGGGILSIDLFKKDGKYIVNEVNATTEFRKSIDAYGVNIPKIIADHVIKEATKLVYT